MGNKTKALFCFAFIMIAVLSFSVSAERSHLKLLAVMETPEGFKGTTADIYLELKPGKGDVYLSTFPLSKVDTQMSTRFAKNMACRYLKMDCSSYDFFYEISANSPFIGGPSAGAAISALTIAALSHRKIDESVTVTGTINSGYLVGAVGEVENKIRAAVKAGLEKVLIPEQVLDPIINSTNQTVDLKQLSSELNISIVEVSNMDDVMYQFTGARKQHKEQEIIVSASYISTMNKLSQDLCNRSELLLGKLSALPQSEDFSRNKTYIGIEESAASLVSKSNYALSKKDYYSAASYCFGANVKYRQLQYIAAMPSANETRAIALKSASDIASLRKKMDSLQKRTMSDLEAYIVVEDRLNDAEQLLKEENISLLDLAYVKERVYSAYSWAEFFGKDGKRFELNKESLADSCKQKFSEAQEYYNYMTYIIPEIFLENIKKDLDQAAIDYNNGRYELCLFRSIKSKARISIMLSTMGVKDDAMPYLLKQKLDAAKDVIVEEIGRGIFPILGYSYYEYAQSLNDTSNSLVYSEYALEFSNLDMYLPQKRKLSIPLNQNIIFGMMIGMFVGAGLVFAMFLASKKAAIRKK